MRSTAACVLVLLFSPPVSGADALIDKPAALIADAVPALPAELAAQRQKLLEISPLTRVKDIRLPIFVVTGANDPRVPASEAEQIVTAIRANGGTAWHLLGQDEGHGFAKKANQDYQFWASLLFWEQTLLRTSPPL